MKQQKNSTQEISKILPSLLKRIHSRLAERVDVPPAQMATLMILFESRHCTFGQLSEEMRVSAPTVSGIIDRLERSKLVKRQRDSSDRRVVNIVLTDKGRKVSMEIQKAFMQRWNTITGILSEHDQKMYVRILKKIVYGLDPKNLETKK